MKVSVIVATYNNPVYLEKVLAGYLCQTRPPDELIVGDDGSGPETRQVVDEFKARAPFSVIHARHEHDGFRLAAVRNMATRASSGEYLIHTDGDCIPGPRFVEDHIRLARKGSFIQGKRILIQEKAVQSFSGQETFCKLLTLWWGGGLKKLHLLFRLPGITVRKKGIRGVRGCNTAFFREDLNKVNGWDERYTGWGREDSDLIVRLLRAGVHRRDALFSAVVFHLYHKEKGKDEASKNDSLLEQAWTGPVFVPNGLVKQDSGKT